MAPKSRASRGRRGGRSRGSVSLPSPSLTSPSPNSGAPPPSGTPVAVNDPLPELAPVTHNDLSPELEEIVAVMNPINDRMGIVVWQPPSSKSGSSRAPEPTEESSSQSGGSPSIVSPTVLPSPPVPSSPKGAAPSRKRQRTIKSKKKVCAPPSLSVKKMLDLVDGINIVQERGFEIARLGEFFKQSVQVQEWTEMLSRMNSVRLNFTLVREFYAQLAVSLGSSHKAETVEGIAVTIRNKQVAFSSSSIRVALGLPPASQMDKQRTDDDLKKISKEYVVEHCYMISPPQVPHDLSCGLLHVSYRLLAYLVRAILYPTSQTSQLPLTEAKFLCYLAVARKKIPAEFYLFESIKKTAITVARGRIGSKSSLFHPAAISLLCQQQEVPVLEGDEVGNLVPLTVSSVNRSNKHSLNPGPGIEVEAAINAARQSAQKLANVTDDRLSKIEDSVTSMKNEVTVLHKEMITLQRMIGDLHEAFAAAGVVIPRSDDPEAATGPPCQS